MTLLSLIGTELPIVQAPMAGVQNSALTIAVCESGGLGSLPCAMLDSAGLEDQLATIRAATDKPFNVNFFCHTPPEIDVARAARWLEKLAPYYAEFGLDVGAAAGGPGRTPFSAEALEILAVNPPAVVSFHFGLPAADLLSGVRALGACIVGCATTVAEARWLQDHGADVIVAQGLEAGGHRGLFLSKDLSSQRATAALVPEVVAAVDLPVVAAGGIATQADVVALMAAGAAGVQVGTAYMLCPEATTSAVHRAALQSRAVEQTVVTNVFSGRPARGMLNRCIDELGPISAVVPEFPLATAALAPLRAAAEAQGLGDFSPLWCGTKLGNVEGASAASVTRGLAAGLD